MSYRQLHAVVRTAALRLGPDPGTVAVHATHEPQTLIGLLAVLTAGGTYCPVDPAFPAARRQTMLAAAGCRVVIGAGLADDPSGLRGLDLSDLLTAHDEALDQPTPGGHTLSDLPWSDVSPADAPTGPASAAGGHLDPRTPAYILFTSGSTGAPKPVVTPRGAISATVHSLRELFGLTPEDRVLQFASLNWDTCFEEILPTLTAGAALVFDDEAHSGSFPRFLRMVEKLQVTVLDLPTAFWHELVLHLTEDQLALPDCLRLVIIGGEAVKASRLADWCTLDTGRIRLLNTYGCTETTLITHAVDLYGPLVPPLAAPWALTGQVPIGRALPHVRERVSEDGELLIGGPALALGYRDLPEPTAARFGTPLPDGERYFRTGDRVGRSPDGLLLHLGRLDHEIKVRGIRVDPAEVEAHIAAHPEVAAVAVTGVVLAGRAALVAYVVPRRTPARAEPGALLEPDALPEPPASEPRDLVPPEPARLDARVRAYLQASVPAHLVPSRITVVPELVHTASGKVDRAGSHQRHAAPQRVKESNFS
ncbi:hypothetical protein GCM10009665_64190 [Kitasatospora nipponensis]|uniref:Nonribosomal peptide synthetase protein VioO n=1 Tax=Kitasatospora nipponensis TaxID=258049 RepID=A0ABN1X1B5_9ACTN